MKRSRLSPTNSWNGVVKTGENNDRTFCSPMNIENARFHTDKRRTLPADVERVIKARDHIERTLRRPWIICERFPDEGEKEQLLKERKRSFNAVVGRANTQTHIFKCAEERIKQNNERNSKRRIPFLEKRYPGDDIERTLRRPCTIYESFQEEGEKEKEELYKERKRTFNADVGSVVKIDVKSKRTLRSPMHIVGWLSEEGKTENGRFYEEEKRTLEADVGRVLRTGENNVRIISSPIRFLDCVHEGSEKVNDRSYTERIKSLEADVRRLTSERDRLQVKTDNFEERHRNMCIKEREMKIEANSLKTEILKCKNQIKDFTMKSTRYQIIENKFKEQRVKLNSIENDKRSLATQLTDKIEELTRMKQTVKELAAHEEMSIKLANEKIQLEKEMSSIEKKLQQMTTKVQDTSQLKEENDMLYDSIESLKGQIKDKDEKIQKRHLEYESLLSELATQQSDNRKILKIAKRSDQRFKLKRTIDDKERFNEELTCAEKNEKHHISEASLWGKHAKRMRTLAEGNLTENDEVSTQESCSESSDDCSVPGHSNLLKTSKKGMVLSDKDKLRKSLTLRKDSNKEM
ncbi:unnamed protein product [Mytilus coruscus]|uniref:Uncharacterized protein n=1 Tax=Mytilus coruscus TaxID=42192 RepID=A0A6J8BBI3_MYTCO|nr:unnamed protein product [Mytilus coruscus]